MEAINARAALLEAAEEAESRRRLAEALSERLLAERRRSVRLSGSLEAARGAAQSERLLSTVGACAAAVAGAPLVAGALGLGGGLGVAGAPSLAMAAAGWPLAVVTLWRMADGVTGAAVGKGNDPGGGGGHGALPPRSFPPWLTALHLLYAGFGLAVRWGAAGWA